MPEVIRDGKTIELWAQRFPSFEAMNAKEISVANLARLNFLLAELYAEAVLGTQRRFHLRAELIGCHGQTLYHQGEPEKFLGRNLAVTWQTGEGAVLAARVGVPVVSDFRPADMAAGGKGALRRAPSGRALLWAVSK